MLTQTEAGRARVGRTAQTCRLVLHISSFCDAGPVDPFHRLRARRVDPSGRGCTLSRLSPSIVSPFKSGLFLLRSIDGQF